MTKIQRATSFYYLIRTYYGANTQLYGKKNKYSFINDIGGLNSICKKKYLHIIL